MKPIDLTAFKVPDGWTAEVVYGKYVMLRSPMGLMATLDLDLHIFRSGMAMHGRPVSTITYTGRGWRQRLTDAAVAHLQAIEGA